MKKPWFEERNNDIHVYSWRGWLFAIIWIIVSTLILEYLMNYGWILTIIFMALSAALFTFIANIKRKK
ncbi:MAG: hypothetical protein M1320_00585 [Patescibacteria group bacterium]|nr:hypothetical protein [Patescibacteria group bacterium]